MVGRSDVQFGKFDVSLIEPVAGAEDGAFVVASFHNVVVELEDGEELVGMGVETRRQGVNECASEGVRAGGGGGIPAVGSCEDFPGSVFGGGVFPDTAGGARVDNCQDIGGGVLENGLGFVPARVGGISVPGR